jgi:hypothetical protein
LAASVTDEIFGPYPATPASQPAAATVSEEHLKKFVGLWRNETTRYPGRFTVENGALRFNAQPMRALSEDTFMLGGTRIKFTFDKDGKPISGEGNNEGDITRFTAHSAWTPTSTELSEIAGDWYSEEAQATVTLVVDGDKAFITQRPSLKLPLQPLYKDHFMAQSYVVWITRDASGKIDKLHVGGSRMRDMWFERVKK